MTKFLVLAAAMAFATAALGQQYKWVDKDGKVRYGDVPPPGVKATPLKPPPPASAPVPQPSAAAAKDAKPKGPLTPAEQEAEYRKRQIEAQKNQEKEAQANQERQAKKNNCSSAQETLRTLEGGRVARTDAKGERYFMDEQQLAQEKAKVLQQVNQSCN